MSCKSKTPPVLPTFLCADLLCLLLACRRVLGSYFGCSGFSNLVYKFGIYIGNTEDTLAFSAISSNEVKLMTRDRSLLKRNKDTDYINKCILFVEEEYE